MANRDTIRRRLADALCLPPDALKCIPIDKFELEPPPPNPLSQ